MNTSDATLHFLFKLHTFGNLVSLAPLKTCVSFIFYFSCCGSHKITLLTNSHMKNTRWWVITRSAHECFPHICAVITILVFGSFNWSSQVFELISSKNQGPQSPSSFQGLIICVLQMASHTSSGRVGLWFPLHSLIQELPSAPINLLLSINNSMRIKVNRNSN